MRTYNFHIAITLCCDKMVIFLDRLKIELLIKTLCFHLSTNFLKFCILKATVFTFLVYFTLCEKYVVQHVERNMWCIIIVCLIREYFSSFVQNNLCDIHFTHTYVEHLFCCQFIKIFLRCFKKLQNIILSVIF